VATYSALDFGLIADLKACCYESKSLAGAVVAVGHGREPQAQYKTFGPDTFVCKLG